jgi:hypothetical protein
LKLCDFCHAAGPWADHNCVALGNFFLSYNPHHPDFQIPLLDNKYFYDASANAGWSLQNFQGSHRWSNSGDINGQTLCITKKSPFLFDRANVPQNHYTYSSVWGSNDHDRALHSTPTIDSQQGWSAAQNDGGQWIQMNLGSVKWVDGIVTQGRGGQWQGGQFVTRYAVLTSEDGYSFSSQGVYPGNLAQGPDLQYTVFKPVRAQFVRVVPVAWNNHITMRVDVLLGDGDSLRANNCQVVDIGSSNGGSKTVTLNRMFQCPHTLSKANWIGQDSYPDKFSISADGDTIIVARTDAPGHGWGMNPRVKCCTP